jgi:hypothetical protein
MTGGGGAQYAAQYNEPEIRLIVIFLESTETERVIEKLPKFERKIGVRAFAIAPSFIVV